MIQRIGRFLQDNLWCEKTHMLYDWKPVGFMKGDFSFLPKPEAIAANRPNPCGYSTGMEDCMLNGGILACVAAELNNIKMANAVFEGLHQCASVSSRRGFLPRGISPYDGFSHYINSSRDQMTNWFFGLAKLYASGLLSKEKLSLLKEDVLAVILRVEEEVTEENDFSTLREDGREGIVTCMWGETIAPHEALRLSMFYLFAYVVSKDAHFYNQYQKYLGEGIEKSRLVTRENFWHLYSALQMQFSLRLIYDYEERESIKAALLAIMFRLAKMLEAETLKSAERLAKPEYAKNFYYPYKSWEEALKQCTDEKNLDFYPLRDLGDGASVIALCPNRAIHPKLYKALESVAKNIDFDVYATSAALDLLYALVLCKDKTEGTDKAF